MPYEDSKRWYLESLESNFDYDTEYMSPVCEIKYCLFCGKELKNE